MPNRSWVVVIGLAVVPAIIGSPVHGGFQYFYNKPAWQQAVGPWVTIDFVQPQATFLSDQYAALGALFTDGDDFAGYAPGSTPSGDEWALASGGFPETSTIQLTTPRLWMGLELPGTASVKLFSGDRLVGAFGAFDTFTGIVSDEPFDRIFIYDGILIDNLYYGGVPAPGVVGLFALTLLVPRSRQR